MIQVTTLHGRQSARNQNCTHLHRVAIALAVTGVLSGVGCTNDGYPLENSWHVQGKAPSASPMASSYRYRYPDVPPTMSPADLKACVAGFSRDRVVLLDVWASWSAQSRDELAAIARLQTDHAEEGLQVIACNLEEPSRWTMTTVPMLHAAGANYPCMVVPESAKAGLREWLGADWQYDLPARFLIDERGTVVGRAFSSTPISSLRQQIRQALRSDGVDGVDGPEFAAAGQSPMGLRVRLINCRTGAAQSLPEVFSDPPSARGLADQAASSIDSHVDRSHNPRIGVLPFASIRDRRKPGPFGIQTADLLMEGLRKRGYYDLQTPAATQELIERLGVTAMSLEYDSSLARNKVPVDYLVIGWLKGPTDGEPDRASAAPDKEAARAAASIGKAGRRADRPTQSRALASGGDTED